MRKSEMSLEQLTHRNTVIQTLSVAGWTDIAAWDWFEEGLWAEFEATMEYKNPALILETHYHAEDNSLYFYLSTFQGGRILLIIKCGDRIREVLNVILSFQAMISVENYHEYVRQLLRVCPEIYTTAGAEDDELVQLVDEP